MKLEFVQPSKSKNFNSETKLFIQGMFVLLNLLIAIFLEKTTKKNNKNSSISSSKSGKDESRLPDPDNKGKGKQETVTLSPNSRTIETVELIPVTRCDVCGNDLSNMPCQHLERRTKIDIIFEKTVKHVDVEVKYCDDCDTTVKGKFPADMPGPLPYGKGLKTYIINLLVAQMVSLNRVQKMIHSILGESISEASLLKFVLRLYQALEGWEVSTIQKIIESPVMNIDETSLRVDKKNQWIHVYSENDTTLTFLHPKRGPEAIKDINIIPRYSGTIIHDFWSSYLTCEHCIHGMCGSHLVRELRYILDSNGYNLALNMKALLLETCKKVSNRKRKKLSEREYSNLQKRYRNITER